MVFHCHVHVPSFLRVVNDGSFRPPWKYLFISLFFLRVKRVFKSAGCNGSEAIPNGHCETTQHRYTQAGRWQKSGSPGPVAILGYVNNPAIKSN